MSGETFGAGGGELLARELEMPLLGKVPLDLALRESGDRGEPVVESRPDSASARALVAIAELLAVPRPGGIRKPLTLLT